MYLSKEEEKILSGELGPGVQRAMEILVSIGDINEAPKLIDVGSVQISGVSYKTIGDAGLDYLEDFSSQGSQVSSFSTLNPAGVDLMLKNPRVPDNFLKKQRRIIKAYKSMGATASCTCTPYLAGNLPERGEHIAWAESSAVAYSNSVIGAKTNRESAITALASALTGKTPFYGLHLDENRSPSFIVDISTDMATTTDYSALGYYVGKNYEGIPIFRGIRPDTESFKALSAGLATGKITMFHVQGVTPNSAGDLDQLESFTFDSENKMEVFNDLNTCDDPDVICVGCPHSTINEIKEVIKSDPDREVWVYTSRHVKNSLKEKIKNKNIKIISDTCMVVQPLEKMGIRSIGTNSAKCAYYSKGLSGLDTKFGTLDDIIKLGPG